MQDSAHLFSGSVPDGYREYLEPVIFEPWAEVLVDFVGVSAGQTVLDVAAGTGVVTRAAASRVGPSGRVIASDVNPAMLAQVAARRPASTVVEIVQCPAADLDVGDGSVDVVLCQQGLPFIPDRAAAAREMRRVLRPRGKVGVAVWLTSARLEPFIIFGDALSARDVPEPFHGAYDSSNLTMSENAVRDMLEHAGFESIEVELKRLELDWTTPLNAARGVAGTPYGPVIAQLPPNERDEVMADIVSRMTAPDGSAVRHLTTSVLAKAVAP